MWTLGMTILGMHSSNFRGGYINFRGTADLEGNFLAPKAVSIGQREISVELVSVPALFGG